MSFKFVRVTLISAIPSWDTVLSWLPVPYLAGEGKLFQGTPLGLLHCDGFLHYRRGFQWICTNYQIGESHYTFGAWGNDDGVGPQTQKTHSELDLVMTPFINWPLYTPTLTGSWWCFWSLDISVNSDPVSNGRWNVWVFPFPQGTITQVNDQRYFGDELGKSLSFILDM